MNSYHCTKRNDRNRRGTLMGTLILILAIIVTNSISGCMLKDGDRGDESARDNSGTTTTDLPEEGVYYSGKEINFDTVFNEEYFATLLFSFSFQNQVYIIADVCEPDPNMTAEENSMSNSTEYIISVGKSGEDIRTTPVKEVIPEGEAPLCFADDESGNLYILTQTVGPKGINYAIHKVDLHTMTMVKSQTIQIETNIAQFMSIALDKQGDIYIYATKDYFNYEVLIYEPEQSAPTRIIDEEVLSGAQLMRKEGQVFLAMRNDIGTEIAVYELGLGKDKLDNPITYNIEAVSGNSQIKGEYLYGISSEGLEIFSKTDSQKIYTWRDMGINRNNYGLPGLSFLSDTAIAVVGSSGADSKLHLAILEQTSQAQNAERKTLVIGGVSISVDTDLQNTIDAFNVTNKKYYAEVVNYSDMGDLYLAILGGNAPDLIWGNQDSTYSALEEQGMLMDLTDIVSDDPVFSKENVLSNILSLYQKNDKLYTLPLSVTLDGMVGTGLPSGAGWTPEEFTSYAESLPEDTYALYGVSQMDLFEGAVMPSMDAFVDWDKRECSFNSAYFESLLVWAGKYGEKEKEENSVTVVIPADELIQNGELAMELRMISSPTSYVSLEKLFGENPSIKGFPSAERNGVTLKSTATVSIYSGTENSEAAWEFVQTAFSAKVQESVRGIPMSRAALDKEIQAAENLPAFMEGDPEYSTYPEMSVESEQRFRNLLETLSGTPADNQADIWAILREEAAAYFSGQKSAAETAEIIQNRVETMVRES